MKTLLLIIAIMLSCSMPVVVPKIVPMGNSNIQVEGFRYYNGRIYVVKSELVPGKYYLESATRIPVRKRVWIEIYVADGHRIILYKIINAKRIPPKPEEWEFEKE